MRQIQSKVSNKAILNSTFALIHILDLYVKRLDNSNKTHFCKYRPYHFQMNRVLFRCTLFSVSFSFQKNFIPKLPLLYSLLWEWLHFVALPLHSLSLQHHPLPHPISLYCMLLYIVLFVVEAKPCSFGSPSANLPFMFMYDDWLIKERRELAQSELCLSSNPLPRWTPGPMVRTAEQERNLNCHRIYLFICSSWTFIHRVWWNFEFNL